MPEKLTAGQRCSTACSIYALVLGVLTVANAAAEEKSNEDLARQLANPVAALISLPFQLNYDRDIGPEDDGER